METGKVSKIKFMLNVDTDSMIGLILTNRSFQLSCV